MAALRPFFRTGRIRRIALWLAGLVALYALIGFFALPWFAKPRIEQALRDALQRPVRIESLYINPFALSARVRGLRILAAKNGEAVAGLDEAYANLSSTSLFRLVPVVDRLRIERPFLHLVRNEDRRYNFQDVIDRYVWSADADEPAEPLRYSLNNIELLDGRIDFDDRAENKRHEVRGLRIGIPFLSNLPYATDILVHPELAAVVNGAPFAVRGEAKPFADTREMTLHLDLEGVELPQYFDYSPIPLRFALVSGLLDTRLTVRMVLREEAPATLLLAGTAALRKVQIRQHDDEPMLAFDALEVELRELDLVGRTLRLGAVKLEAPQVQLTRFRGGRLNLELLLPLDTGKPPRAGEAETETAPFRYAVETLQVRNGNVQVLDYAAPAAFKTALAGISVDAERIGNLERTPGSFQARLRLDKGSLQTQGELALAPFAMKGRFELADIALPRFQPYLGDERRLADGTLTGEGRYRIGGEDGETEIAVEDLNAVLRDTRIHTAAGQDRWRAGRVEVRNARLDLAKRDIRVEEVLGQDVAATVLRTADGDWHLSGFTRLAAQAAAEAAQEQAPEAAPWHYRIGRIALERTALHYEDRTPAQPVSVQLREIKAELKDLANTAEAAPQLAVDATVGKSGRLSLVGPLTLSPFGFEWRLRAAGIPLLPFKPYWASQIELDITRGALQARGRLLMRTDREGRTPLRFAGRIAVTDFSAREGGSRRDLMRWRALALRETLLQSDPMLVRIGAVSLRDFYLRLVLQADGTLNLQRVFGPPQPGTADDAPVAQTAQTEAEAPAQSEPAAVQPAQAAASAPVPQAKPRIEIGEVRLAEGQLDFSDLYIKPNYSAQIASLQGSIGRLTPEQAGRIELQGEIDKVAPVTVSGLINPLGQSLFLDIQAAAKGVNLPPLSPYAVRYIGYPIERGKLSMDVQYRIENGELTAHNQLILNQLVFGEKVESPEAVNVPVHLAVALLKDGNGVINLDVPISGSLNDPQFSLGSVIARAIGNLFIKVVTSPFAALGALFGGDGERLGYIEFAPGSAELNEEALRKLQRLARAMNNRPALTLDIAGRVDPDAEGEALRRESLMRRLRALKLEDLARELDNPPRLDEVEIAPEEYERYLRRAYRRADFDKPRNFLGFPKRLPLEETERLLLAHIEISEAAMRRLANRRAEAVLNWLRNEGQVPADRVYVAAPRLDAADNRHPDAATTRVDLAVRR